MRSVADRFWDKVDKRGPDDCWPWLGARSRQGYGYLNTGGRKHLVTKKSHRIAWELRYGDIPTGMHVLHSCDLPECCNVAHLRLGTNADNVRDKMARGRLGPREGRANGHARLTENDVDLIRMTYDTLPVSQSAIARAWGINHSHVRRIIFGKAWKHVA